MLALLCSVMRVRDSPVQTQNQNEQIFFRVMTQRVLDQTLIHRNKFYFIFFIRILLGVNVHISKNFLRVLSLVLFCSFTFRSSWLGFFSIITKHTHRERERRSDAFLKLEMIQSVS